MSPQSKLLLLVCIRHCYAWWGLLSHCPFPLTKDNFIWDLRDEFLRPTVNVSCSDLHSCWVLKWTSLIPSSSPPLPYFRSIHFIVTFVRNRNLLGNISAIPETWEKGQRRAVQGRVSQEEQSGVSPGIERSTFFQGAPDALVAGVHMEKSKTGCITSSCSCLSPCLTDSHAMMSGSTELRVLWQFVVFVCLSCQLSLEPRFWLWGVSAFSSLEPRYF